ncbi:hypothetical protein HK096_000923 [Nowakowskiella sp. JEL0078]|nr:hypothetical protein HK096_000923 [Nowakowskiella sp. JEL0078]
MPAPRHVNEIPPFDQTAIDQSIDESDIPDIDDVEFSVRDVPMASCPPFRPLNIHNIVETVDRYNPQNIEILESYVLEQLQTLHYDRDSCLAILKLYQFNPLSTNSRIISNILTLSLGALPDPDFSLCLCLLNDSIISDPIIQILIRLHTLLETCQFSNFWKDLDDLKASNSKDDKETYSIIREYKGFKEMVRLFIAQVVSVTYQTVKLDLLAEYVDLAGDALSDWIDDNGWAFDDENPQLVNMPMTKDNMPKPAIVKENIAFEQLTKIIGYGRLTV